MYYLFSTCFILLGFPHSNIFAEKINLDTLNNYSEFLNFGDKKLNKVNKEELENAIFKSKIDVLGEIFKTNIDSLKASKKLDIVFLIDSSSSVGEYNFKSELKFVKKLLSDITVDYNHTRVAIITFSSPSNIIRKRYCIRVQTFQIQQPSFAKLEYYGFTVNMVYTNASNIAAALNTFLKISKVKNVDEISQSSNESNKCLLLNKQLNNVIYEGGETFTIGAFRSAKEIFDTSDRNDSKKVLFLITDGYSNGGDPVPLANDLKNSHVTIFTIGIQNGNYKELYELSSSPGEFYSYLLDSFNEFESLARRALHVDLKSGDYIPIGLNQPCDVLCKEGDCCDSKALCTCGTTTGHYACVCEPGYYGTGLKNSCLPCIPGTYSDGPNLCLPCPDIHHTTTPPAHGIESCKCKEGYRPTKNNGCKALKCSKISPPEHGYFVKKRECTNILNSACGIRCEVGYTLAGSSIRLCQLNATWSGNEPTCEVKTCMQLPAPKYGSVKCIQPDMDVEYEKNEKNLPVDTICNFECGKAKVLIGSAQRTCLPLARWDGLRTTCKQIKCNKLPQIKFGRIEPSSCTSSKQEFGKKCKIICNDGFKIGGPAEKRCVGSRGTWDSKFEDTVCTDITPPKLLCPENITTNALPGRKYGHVLWIQPNATDNSGLQVSIWTTPAIEKIAEIKFQVGRTPVTYYAQDAFHNKAKCTFYITVEDKEPPTIENCISPPTFLTTESKGANITWDEPYIYDNSQTVQVNKTHEFGFFELGTTTITYTAVDGSGNTNTCKMNITVEDAHCEYLPNPLYGHSECSNQDDGIQCLITCQEGYAIPIPDTSSADNGTSFICNHADPEWVNHDGLMFPECTVTKIPDEIIQSGEISVTAENNTCNDTEKIEELENDVKISLNTDICIGNCTTDTSSECETETKEENFNKILRKRQTNFQEVPHKNRNKKQRKKVNVKFQVRGKYINSTNIKTGFIKLRSGLNVTVHYNKPKFVCPTGFVPRKNRCVQCPKGTFQNVTKNRCNSCPFGYYNDKLGQTSCIACPLHHSTRKMHSKKADDCKEECPPGTRARKKFLKYSKHHPNVTIETATLKPYCRSCPVGFYQPDYGQLKCLPCPSGHTTTGVRSVSISQCIPTSEEICKSKNYICNNGTCATTNEYQYSCNCFENYIGTNCEKLVNDCASQPCFNNGICIYLKNGYECKCKEGSTGKLCEEIIDQCNMKCLNNGTCIENDINEFMCFCPPGYGGDYCEISIKFCSEGICENNSTCVEEQNTFRCGCSNGFIGRRCNILPCDYKPCQSDLICINIMEENASKKSYKCVCPEGYTGENCTTKINYCESSPCQNGGTCSSNETTYACDCSSLYYGYNCEYKRNTKYLLHFKRYDINDYVKLNGFTHNITEITACLWMQTTDSFNYGTLLSYATRYTDNAFTLTDYTGLVLYVNNNYVVTDVLLNDGYWHHVCTTWQSLEGLYKVYVDGIVIKNGTGLSAGTVIQGWGNMIIGQEQDVMGGKFSQAESFVGKMTYIDIWSKTLSDEDILIHFNDCNESFFGNLYSWPEVQNYVNGAIQIMNSSFCNKCEEPQPVYNGVIDVVDNVAYYSCYSGFQLNTNKYDNGRKCTKASKWEGFYEPYCKKIYCGYPGYVTNGYHTGNDYFYGDNITYNCYDGFNLVGNITVTCEENGKWSPNKPQCLGVQCVAFKHPANSEINIMAEQSYEDFVENKTKFDIGTQIEITCHQNASIMGENIITCLENGTWDFDSAECILHKQEKHEKKESKLDCSLVQIPPSPINGYIDLKSLYAAGNGSTNFVEYKCRPGYTLHGDNITSCIIDGYWTEPNISCDAIICVEPPIPKTMELKHEALKKETYHFGNMLSFKCEEGYSMFGNSMIRCLPNGKWSRMQAKCIKKSCKKPNVNEETVIQGKSYLFGDKVTLICPNGSNYEIICNKFGVWEGQKDDSC